MRSGARPDDLVPVERALHQDGVDLRERKRRDGAGRKAGRVLHLVGLRDSRRAASTARATFAGRSDGHPERARRPAARRRRGRATSRSDRGRSRPRRPRPGRSTCRRGTRGCAPRLPHRGGRRTPARRALARLRPRAQPSSRSVDEGDEPVTVCVCSTRDTSGTGREETLLDSRLQRPDDGEGGGADERPRRERK